MYFLGLKMNSIGGILGAILAIAQAIINVPKIKQSMVICKYPPPINFLQNLPNTIDNERIQYVYIHCSLTKVMHPLVCSVRDAFIHIKRHPSKYAQQCDYYTKFTQMQEKVG